MRPSHDSTISASADGKSARGEELGVADDGLRHERAVAKRQQREQQRGEERDRASTLERSNEAASPERADGEVDREGELRSAEQPPPDREQRRQREDVGLRVGKEFVHAGGARLLVRRRRHPERQLPVMKQRVQRVAQVLRAKEPVARVVVDPGGAEERPPHRQDDGDGGDPGQPAASRFHPGKTRGENRRSGRGRTATPRTRARAYVSTPRKRADRRSAVPPRSSDGGS